MLMLKYIETKTINHKFTQNQIAKQMRFFDSTIKRHRNDKSMDNPYNRSSRGHSGTSTGVKLEKLQLQNHNCGDDDQDKFFPW